MDKKLKTTKTNAKRIGLKSTLVFDDKIVISSFADDKQQKGASKNIAANVEKETRLNGEEINTNLRLFESVNVDEELITIKSKSHKDIEEVKYANPAKRIENDGEIANSFDSPARYIVGQDYIGVKSAIEKKYFGKEFEVDNARVQIGYNIADIKKILTLYINNVVYMFYHLAKVELAEDEDGNAQNDVIGTLPFYKSFEEQSEQTQKSIKDIFKNLQIYFEYFDGAFEKIGKDTSNEKEAFRHNYEILCLLSYIRQACMHDGEVKISETDSVSSDAMLYRAKDVLPQNLKDRLASIYDGFVDGLKNDFATNSANNLYILKQIYKGNLSAESLGKEYFDFALLKEQNNIGVNLKKIREIIIDSKHRELRDDKYNKFRSKLYKILDFVLLHYLVVDNERKTVNEMITRLRFCENDKEKDEAYVEFANKIYNGCKNIIADGISAVEKEDACEYVNKFPVEDTSKLKQAEKIDNTAILTAITDRFGKMTNVNPFSKLLFLMTKFLDGKEINELLCALMNKFDNIADLTDTVYQKKKNNIFAADYDMFKTSRTRATDMRIIKNFARMKVKSIQFEKSTLVNLINPAFNLLGLNDNAYKNGTAEYKFVLNNVLKSRRFFYVIKYTDPKKGRAIIQSRVLVDLALKDLPDTQIERYYKSVFGKDMISADKAKEALIEKMMCYSKQDIIAEDEKAKALVGLYLTVIYLVTKNLVKVNARFAIAFSCLERDRELMKDRLALCANENKNMLAITRHFIENDTAVFKEFRETSHKLATLPDAQRKVELKKLSSWCKSKQHFKSHDYACIAKHLLSFIEDSDKLDFVEQKNEVQISDNNPVLYSVNAKNVYISPLKNFRNKIAHVNIMSCFDKYIADMKYANSYYGAYCYIMQRMLIEDDGKNLFGEYKAKLAQYKSYNQDLMKLLCIPFAYNLPRYKNLSTEALFNLDTKKTKT